MKRKLLTQMLAEWRSNLWLIIELVIVIAVLQFIFSFLCMMSDIHSDNKGYDLHDIYVADINAIPSDSPDYHPYDSLHSLVTDRDMLLARLRTNPYVEIVGIGSGNAMPYNFNYYGQTIGLIDNDTTYTVNANMRRMSPDVIRAIRLTGINGESTEQLASMIEKGDILLSDVDKDFAYQDVDPVIMRGRDVFIGDTSFVRHVGAIAYGMRRTDFEPLGGPVAYAPLESDRWGGVLVVRVKEGMGDKFIASMGRDEKSLGNIYLSDLKTIDVMRDKAHLNYTQYIRNFTICAAFIMLVIFLGFLGTFWFRTQQRVGEIAIRKVNGATDRSIFARLVNEGLILLVIGTVITVPIPVVVLNSGVLDDMGMTFIGNGLIIRAYIITVMVLSALIALGIWAPARKAMKVNPAYALKDQ